MQLRLFSQKSKKKTGIPSPIFGWKNNEKPRYTTVSYGFLMFLVDFYFKCWRWPEAYPGRQLWGGLVGSLSAAVASFVNWKGRFVGSPLSSEPKTCVCCFFFKLYTVTIHRFIFLFLWLFLKTCWVREKPKQQHTRLHFALFVVYTVAH